MSTLLATRAALLDLVRSYPDATFDASNSALDDWQVLISGGREYSAVIEMDEATQEGDILNDYGQQGWRQELHHLALWVCVKRGQGEGGDAAQKQTLITLTEGLKDYLRPFVRLNDTPDVVAMRIISTSAPVYVAPRSIHQSSTHVAQQVRVQVQCERPLDAWE